MFSATCRNCGQSGLKAVLDLGMMPLLNGLLIQEQLAKPEGILFTIEFSRFIRPGCESFPLAGFSIPVNISSIFEKSFYTLA